MIDAIDRIGGNFAVQVTIFSHSLPPLIPLPMAREIWIQVYSLGRKTSSKNASSTLSRESKQQVLIALVDSLSSVSRRDASCDEFGTRCVGWDSRGERGTLLRSLQNRSRAMRATKHRAKSHEAKPFLMLFRSLVSLAPLVATPTKRSSCPFRAVSH